MEEEGFIPVDANYATRSIHEGQDPGQWNSKAVVPPITMACVFKLDKIPDYPDHNSTHYNYSRLNNPNRDLLEKNIASLENSKYCVCYSSGMAAITSVMHILKFGDHVLGAKDIFGGTTTFLKSFAIEQGLESGFFDSQNLNSLEEAIKPNTKMVWVESPSNPTLNVTNLRKVAEICHKNSREIIVVIDNTYMTSYLQKPLELGIDISLYSVSKYMNGHCDVVMGAVAFNDEKIHARLRRLQHLFGGIPSPFECYLVTRGMKTLVLRMRQHMTNSMEVAKFLQSHPRVEKVIHPGLPDHPQHELFKSQTTGWSGMVSFYIKDAGIKGSIAFMKSLKYFIFASTFGDVGSLVSVPAIQSHVTVPEEERNKVGITDNLIRLSVGIEDAEDLINDLDQALKLSLHE